VIDSTKRFSDRVENYVRYRPGYPSEVLQVLADEADLTRTAIVADIGSGTGISSKLFLDFGNTVYGVEPNDEMRAAAERLLSDYSSFHSIAGTAENTTLAEASMDFVVAGQAFHWFDHEKARGEFARILRPGGVALLMWNTRRNDTPFAVEYEELLHRYGTDYGSVNHKNITATEIERFFSPALVLQRKLPNHQMMDLEALTGRILSCSYMPAEGHPQFVPMLAAIRELFERHQTGGQVRLEYETEVYFGCFTPSF
jgi:SAM-dependent methyltransferase